MNNWLKYWCSACERHVKESEVELVTYSDGHTGYNHDGTNHMLIPRLAIKENCKCKGIIRLAEYIDNEIVLEREALSKLVNGDNAYNRHPEYNVGCHEGEIRVLERIRNFINLNE